MSSRMFSARSAALTAKYSWGNPETYNKTRRSVDEAYTLPGAVYTDTDFFQLEQENISKKGWTAVCETSSVASHGDMYPFEIGGQSYFVTNSEGVRRGFHNVCRPRGAKLTVMATPHLDNQTPGETSEEIQNGFDKNENILYPLRLAEWGGLVFANVEGNAPDLQHELGDIKDQLGCYPWHEMVAAGTKTYDIKANWKLLVENFQEYYHLPMVHPALCAVSTVDNHVRRQGLGKYSAYATVPMTRGGTVADAGAWTPFPGIGEVI